MRSMRLVLMLVLLNFASHALASHSDKEQQVQKQSHCGSDEHVVFSCVIGTKIASLCASKDLDRSNGYLQYRFGKKGKPEISAPNMTASGRNLIKVVRSPSSTANAIFVSIRNGDYTYYVYSSESVGSVKDSMRSWVYSSGVEVQKTDKVIFSRDCMGKAHDELGTLFLDSAFEVEVSGYAWAIGSRDPQFIEELKESRGH